MTRMYGLRDPDGRCWHSTTGYPLEPRPGWTTVVAVLVPGEFYEWVEAS
jgi:hypothetical protein